VKTFTRLFTRLDGTTRTSEKLEALREYFAQAPPEDAAWALHLLSGGRPRRAVSTRLLREWVSGETGLPLWLVEECYGAVGDLAETLALLLPDGPGLAEPLHRVMEGRILPLAALDEAGKRAAVLESWSLLGRAERFVWHKLITGGFRVGVARTLVTRALAEVAGVDRAVMAHRLTGPWHPGGEAYLRLLLPQGEEEEEARPYPFLLAHPLEGGPGRLGDPDEWEAEWKWDGIRAQLLRRGAGVRLCSRGEEAVEGQFPEVAEAAMLLPAGTVLDGELVAWREGRPLPFHTLQRRLGRKQVGRKLLAEVPVRFLAFDCLESDGRDLRGEPLVLRQERLRAILRAVVTPPALALSPPIPFGSWEELARIRDEARERGVEGVMLKGRASPYRVGRVRGDWWKWKVDPHRVDAVLLYAQRGHGRRAGLYTDYTFGVHRDGDLVPVAKAYSGLSDAEIREVDRWIRDHTVETFGPVRAVSPGLVFELAFEAIHPSPRHRSGVALRFPRMARWRRDKTVAEADHLERLLDLLPAEAGSP